MLGVLTNKCYDGRMTVSQRVNMIMGIKEWKPKDLVRASGLSYRTVNRILNGEDIYVSTLEKLVGAFGITAYEFYSFGVPRLRSSLTDAPLNAPDIAAEAIQKIVGGVQREGDT